MICFAVTNFINCFIDETNESYDAYFIKSCRPAIIPVETIVTRLPPNTPYEVLPAFPNNFNIFIFRHSLLKYQIFISFQDEIPIIKREDSVGRVFPTNLLSASPARSASFATALSVAASVKVSRMSFYSAMLIQFTSRRYYYDDIY